MSASKQCGSDKEDSTENYADTWVPPKHSTTKISQDEQTLSLRKIFESVEDMMTSLDYDEDLRNELSSACPNYMTVFQTAKRDLLRNDCGIVVAGETSAGKTTLVNQLVGNRIFSTSILAATGKITRIRNSRSYEIKCYSEDDILQKEEEFQDIKQLKSAVKELTDIRNCPDDDIYYVDVHLPVPILKGNVIIVDTPGIGENEKLEEMLLNFLPHAVSFVFVVNAKNAGGVHTDRLLKIMETVIRNRYKMPCFDPSKVMFLTNQWDIIKNDKSSSDRDGDGNKEKDDQHTRTWKKILTQIEKKWCCFNEENVFRVSLKQVRKGIGNFFTDEYKRFETVLKERIDTNKNKRIEYYYRFLNHFIRNAQRGALTRVGLLGRSEEEQQRIISQNNEKIHDLQLKCKQAKQELKSHKTKTITMLTDKLYVFLHSNDGRSAILNPPGITKINQVTHKILREEVPFRIRRGIKRWCDGEVATSIIEEAEDKIISFSRILDSNLNEIETTEIYTRVVCDNTADPIFQKCKDPLFTNIKIAVRLYLYAYFIPFIFIIGKKFVESEISCIMANDMYDACIKDISKSELRESFEKSFGVEYDMAIVNILDESLLNGLNNLLVINEGLFDKYDVIKETQESITKLEEKIRHIQTATKIFERSLKFACY